MPINGSLYFGDNLFILRDHIKDETIDLIYLDPPFNSNATYNVLFKSPKGQNSDAQIEAFEDTWHWGEQAENEFNEIIHSGNTEVAELIQAIRKFLGENDLMAYLVMMGNRLLELHRVLKDTGSIYLHCDPTASHYLKVLMDGVFGPKNIRNEIIWNYKKWATADSRFSRNHDVILFYAKNESNLKFNVLLQPRALSTLKRFGNKKIVSGFDEYGNRVPSQTLDEDSDGVKMSDVWDIPIIAPSSNERLGYPTQKPLALLDRIIRASSDEGDLVLDPFCGCGTAVHAAHRLNRTWIGIDITHLAISLIEKRLNNAFPGIAIDVHGTPKDLAGAFDLAKRDKYQFQWWACSLVNAHPYKGKKKGADTGIDGIIYFQEDNKNIRLIIVSIKGGGNVHVNMIRELAHVVEREKAAMGLFITLENPTKPMETEALKAGYYHHTLTDREFRKIQILTIQGLLDGTQNPAFPNLTQGSITFKKAKQDTFSTGQNDLF